MARTGRTVAASAVLLLTFASSLLARQEGGGVPFPSNRGAADTVPTDTLPGAPVSPDTIPADTAAAPPPLSAAADSVLQALRALPGFTATEYHGRSALYRADTGVLRLEGEAEVVREQDRLTADTIIYRERARMVEAYGSPRVIGQQQDIAGDVLFYDLDRRRATALGARTQIEQQATWFVTGDVTLEGTDRLFGSHAHFTSCDLEIPHYHFEADQIMVIRDRVLVARPARLYFGNVPVMVLPFVVQSLEQGRRSGFLTPRFGVHDIVRTSSGYNRQISDVGFYWAVNQYMGATLSTTWRSGAYTALLGNVDYNWRRQFLSGNLGLERYWRPDGRRELSLNTRSAWQPDERTSLSLSGRYASSSDFVQQSSYDPREVTQDLNSSFSLTRRFNWGQTSLGAERRQSIGTGDVLMTLPSFSISRSPITFFPAATPETERWYSNATFSPGVVSGSRASDRYAQLAGRLPRQNRDQTRFQVGPSFTVGNFSISGSGEMNRAEVQEAAGVDREGLPILLRPFDREEANWSLSASYRQQLIGTTNLSPSISLSQQLLRDTITADALVRAPVRLTFGSSLSTDLYGFFPGFAGLDAIRHKLSPRLGYGYTPEVQLTPVQEQTFGRPGGRAQNRINLSLSQTWEGRLRTPQGAQESVVPQDSLTGDTIPRSRTPAQPLDPQKVTILAINTSAFEYDFVQAREEGTGFVTNMVSNTISSDYLRGLTIQMQHELFDRRDLDPNLAENTGRLGRFAPALATLGTSFELGPQTALIQWLDRFAFGARPDRSGPEQVLPGDAETDVVSPAGQSSHTGNPQGMGGGPWSIGLSYQFSRPPRVFAPDGTVNYEAIQTLDANMRFQLSPNWSVNWNTSYSMTDREFGAHRLNFQRDLHEWQANFSFYQTPYGYSGFEFYVELLHNRDLRFDYREGNLGVDRQR